MRYTTVIDITEIPMVYRSPNVRLLYLHMALRCGYHSDDRDLCSLSIRRMAFDCRLTVSAVRHALLQLEKYGLLKRVEDGYLVKKYVEPEKVPSRPKQSPSRASQDVTQRLRQADLEAEQYARKVESVVRQCTVEELQAWAQELADGRSLRHHGVQINANMKNVQWLNEVIKRR